MAPLKKNQKKARAQRRNALKSAVAELQGLLRQLNPGDYATGLGCMAVFNRLITAYGTDVCFDVMRSVVFTDEEQDLLFPPMLMALGEQGKYTTVRHFVEVHAQLQVEANIDPNPGRGTLYAWLAYGAKNAVHRQKYIEAADEALAQTVEPKERLLLMLTLCHAVQDKRHLLQLAEEIQSKLVAYIRDDPSFATEVMLGMVNLLGTSDLLAQVMQSMESLDDKHRIENEEWLWPLLSAWDKDELIKILPGLVGTRYYNEVARLAGDATNAKPS